MRVVVLAALGVAGMSLAGCAGAGRTEVDPANLPPNYRQVVADRVKQTFFDPYSIRDASISQPIGGVAVTGQVTTICVRANAKNRLGGYTGLKETSYTFRAGVISVADDQYAGLTCGGAVYEPFPEIDTAAQPAPKGR